MEAQPAIRAVIVDFGGVMATDIPRNQLPRLSPELTALVEFFQNEFRTQYHLFGGRNDFDLWETGAIDEIEMVRRVCSRFEAAHQIAVDPLRARQAIIGPGMVASVPMVDAVRALHERGLLTAIITNIGTGSSIGWRALIPVETLFDVVFDSSVEGMRKPDPRAFLEVCRRLGVSPEECVFIDDRVQNVAAAKALGMRTILCADPPTVAAHLLRCAQPRSHEGAQPPSPNELER